MRKSLLGRCYLAIALLFAGSFASHAQTITGGVNGTVTDASGAVIQGATVTATNQATNVQTATKTNNDGIYVIKFL